MNQVTEDPAVVTDAPGPNDPVLELSGISKSFGAVRVLHDASLLCYPGEVHALVGENGAGKSTLIKIASGLLRPDTGTVRIAGQELRHASAIGARQLGLLTAYQDTSLVHALTAAENLVLSYHGFEPLQKTLPWRKLDDVFERYELPFGPDDVVGNLSPASRQLLEVVRTLIHRPKLLLLDEPTAALDRQNTQRLEKLIETALAEDTAVLYVSHRLDEVKRMAQRLTVLRDGEIQGLYVGGDWSVDEIVQLMVGVPTDLEFPPKPAEPLTTPKVLESRDLSGEKFGPISLDVRSGEIVGVAGAEGNGQRELLRALVGLRNSDGETIVNGKPTTLTNPAVARRAGIAFVSGDRAAESVFRQLSVMENTTSALDKELGPAGLVVRGRQLKYFNRVADDLSIVYSSPDQPAGELSGGNQQKVVLGRVMLTGSSIWIVDEPTQGVDARARVDMYRVLREQAAQGTAILVNSSDSAELAGICDRVYVLSRGLVVRELAGDDLVESRIVESFVDIAADPHAAQELHLDLAALADAPAVTAVVDAPVVAASQTAEKSARGRGFSVPPLAVLVGLLLLLAGYTATQSDVFLSDSNLNAWFIPAVPLAILALGLQVSLLSGEFDISVGSTMSLTVVLLSFWASQDTFLGAIPGVLGVLGVGVAIGLLNSFIVRVLKVGAIIGTIGTLGIIAGLAIVLRPTPGGFVGLGLTEVLATQIGFVPVALIVVVLLAIAADVWRVKTPAGLSLRAVGLSEEASVRTGLRLGTSKVASYVVCALFAVVAGIFLGGQLGVGTNDAGVGFPLLGFTACFLGGAALTGGQGTFTGAVIGALFLTLLVNVVPLLELATAWSNVVTGALTILAVAAYSLQRTGASRGPSRPARRGRRTRLAADAGVDPADPGGPR